MTTVIGLRDRALIGLMVYSSARIGAISALSTTSAPTLRLRGPV
jgi:hypothetical protein